MSLLLEALKKAEKAKEEAQRRAKGEAANSQADPDATVVDPGRPVMTRAELPDISAPLEILSEDIRANPSAPAVAPALSLVEEPPPAPEPKPAGRREAARSAPASAAAEAARTDRATAQKVFEAKFREPNPRLPFYIVVGTLTLLGIGTAIYFWLQLRPAPTLVNPNPPPPAGEKPVAAAEQRPSATQAPADGQSSAPATAIPGLPGAAGSQPAAAPNVLTPAPKPSVAGGAPSTAAPAKPADAPVPAAVKSPAPAAKPPARASARPAPAAKADEAALTVNRGVAQIHPGVAAGYAAYQAGDLAAARSEYQKALREDPGNRDATLGLAAVEMRAQRYDLADALYQRLLQANPRDPHAQAGMLALRGQQVDPVQAESRVKSLLALDRDANVLYFTLGNQYAQQGRWAEAQQAYFKAYAADPGSPDFAFNLAVSLEHLGQLKPALEYYQRALALAEKRAANFAPEAARARVQQLSAEVSR